MTPKLKSFIRSRDLEPVDTYWFFEERTSFSRWLRSFADPYGAGFGVVVEDFLNEFFFVGKVKSSFDTYEVLCTNGYDLYLLLINIEDDFLELFIIQGPHSALKIKSEAELRKSSLHTQGRIEKKVFLQCMFEILFDSLKMTF